MRSYFLAVADSICYTNYRQRLFTLGSFFMKIEQFTEKAREAISEANELAKQYNHSQIEAEHLLAALLAQEGGVVQQIIQKVGGNLATAQRMGTADLERLPRVYGGSLPGDSLRGRRILFTGCQAM